MMDYAIAYFASITITLLVCLVLDRPRKRRIRFVSCNLEGMLKNE